MDPSSQWLSTSPGPQQCPPTVRVHGTAWFTVRVKFGSATLLQLLSKHSSAHSPCTAEAAGYTAWTATTPSTSDARNMANLLVKLQLSGGSNYKVCTEGID
jgi:hypothetical protein